MSRTTWKILVFIAILASEAWLLAPGPTWQPAFEPIVALVFFILLYVLIETGGKRRTRAKLDDLASRQDERLFMQIQHALPEVPVMHFFREHDFIKPFERERVEPLYVFLSLWRDPDTRFLHQPLQESADTMSRHATEVMLHIGRRASAGQEGLLSIKSPEGSPAAADEARHLNESASAFVTAYEELQRRARKLLHVKTQETRVHARPRRLSLRPWLR